MHDDQRYFLPAHADVVKYKIALSIFFCIIFKILQNNNAAKYIDGIGVHWYGDFLSSAKQLTKTHNFHPDKFILPTEVIIV